MKQSISIKRTAHYHLQLPDNQNPIAVLYVIHGYAQLASEFIADFKPLKESNILVVAPEGLSKFYNKERKPVASWMTSHERLNEIDDYISYLNQLHEIITNQFNPARIMILGFSQGVSTAFRWFSSLKEKELTLYACSGTIPPELDKKDFLDKKDAKVNYYYGSIDKLLSLDKAKEQLKKIEDLNLRCEAFPFDGRHEISKTCISHLLEFN